MTKTSFTAGFRTAHIASQWRFKKDVIDKWIKEQSLRKLKDGANSS